MSYRTLGGERINRVRETRRTLSGYKDGDTRYRENRSAMYEKANPGNVVKVKAGGGHMGSDLAHDNEAPFPESLADFFVLSSVHRAAWSSIRSPAPGPRSPAR